MQRSALLVAAGMWLLSAACGEAREAKAPLEPSRQPPAARASQVSVGASKSGPAPLEPQPAPLQKPEGVAPRPAHPTSRELAERFGGARALSVLQGSASYYSDALAGRSTASGAPYEPRAFTAAHRTLPFGSVLRVTRADGGGVVYVKVNDRGPYGPRGRIVDLSRAAAEQLGMLRAGVVRVKVEVLEYGPRKQRRRRP